MESGLSRLMSRGHRMIWLATLFACAFPLAGCSSGPERDVSLGNTGSTNDGAAPDYAVAYIRRALPSTTDPNAVPLVDDLRIQRVWNGPADVWLRERAAPTALEKNITSSVTGGTWDVRDLDTSFDGTKVIFSMRPPLKKNVPQSEQPKWAIYEYDAPTATLRKVISDPIAADLGHDVGPHYLPDGRIVFSSTRQHDAKAVLIDEGKQQFSAGIEGNRNLPAFVLHVMNPDGTGIHQLSFNTGHDLDPSVMPDGRIVFTRWDIPSGAGMHLYAVDPDGGNLQLLYGRNSHDTGTPGSIVQFSQARARPDGRIVALLRPFSGTDFGGDLALIDSANFVENLQTVLGAAPAAGANGQARIVSNDVQTVPAVNGAPVLPSPGGRFSSVFPLWDGTNRMLVSWSECRLLNQGTLVPCTAKNLALPGVVSAPPLYSIWILDPANNTQLPVVPPAEGTMLTDAVVLQPRLPTPTVLRDATPGNPASYSFTLAAENVGILNIKSVYDFDGVDMAPGGLAVTSDPSRRAADPRRPRFMRIEKAVSLPDNEVLPNNALPNYAFGIAGNYMRELIGYAPVEPDGSVRVKIPANIPIQITFLDANGRRVDGLPPAGFPRHRAWLQVRTGEIVTCNGCHVQNTTLRTSHGRNGLFAPVNHGAAQANVAFAGTALLVKDRTGNLVPAGRLPVAGETMAEYRSAVQIGCVDPACAADPALDLAFDDVWTTGTTVPDPSFAWMYANLGTPAPVRADCTTNWQGNCRGVIHYPVHIAPLWTTPRTTITAIDPLTTAPYQACTDCHSPRDSAGVRRVPAGQLDLTSSPASAPCDQLQFTSFCQLLLPHPLLDPVTIQPIVNPGPPPVTVQVNPPMSGAGANASATFFSKFTTGTAPTSCAPGAACPHTGWLTAEELKLVSEWLDLGAQYYNDPFAIPPPN